MTLACYTDRLSVRPGERFDLHASAEHDPCRVVIARIGAERREVLSLEGLAVGDHPIPPHADRDGCGWPVTTRVEVGDWASGYYDILLTDAAGGEAHHFVCVKPPAGQRRSCAMRPLNSSTDSTCPSLMR